MGKHALYRPVLVSIVFILALCCTGPAMAQEPAQPEVRITQVDTGNFPEVVVYVSVEDAAGEPVGIEAERLQLLENGERVEVENVQGIGQALPITTLLLVDVSGSMNVDNKLDAARNAALSYVNTSREIDRIGLTAFNTQVTVVQEITTDKDLVRAGIESLEGIYDTSMLDALMQGISQLKDESGRRAIILMTDGLDNQSQSTLEELLQELEPQDVSVSTIGFGNREHDQEAMSAVNEEMLEVIASAGGGVYSYAEDGESLQEIYNLYGRALRSEYVIRYTSPSGLRDGVNRTIDVRLAAVDSMIADPAEQGAVYNPGGVVPESAGMAPWPLFFIILAPLVLLLLVPGVVRMISGGREKGKKSEGRIRLH